VGTEHPVLVVDDDRDVRESLGVLLGAEGYRVVEAADGDDALARLRTGEEPCLILLDLMMPRKNGWEFRREQLRDPRLAAVPVVVLSAHDRVREQARELGVRDWLSKPVDVDRLLGMVEAYCSPLDRRA
jgi:CheY-like chemotaxis protein